MNNLFIIFISLPSDVAEEEKESEQLYVDDLRAGAFHGMKVSEDMSRLPLAYELVFCDCSGSPYMIWKYPQPRTIIKLHMFPIVTEVNRTITSYFRKPLRFSIISKMNVATNDD